MGEADGDLLMSGEDQLGRPIASVVDQRVVQPAVGRARVQRDVLDARRTEEVDDQVRAVLGSHRRWYCTLSKVRRAILRRGGYWGFAKKCTRRFRAQHASFLSRHTGHSSP